MKDCNSTAANVGQNIVAIDALVQTPASKAYIVHTHAGEALSVGVQGATYQGQDAAFIRVAVDDAELENYVASAGGAVEVVELPSAPAARAALIAKWAKKTAEKNKTGWLPLLLLPLAACGGGDTSNPFGVAETPTDSGKWLIDSDNGAVSLSAVDSNYVLTPATGSAATVAQADVTEFVVNSITLTADAADISGETVTGTGTVVVANVEADLDVDLGNISTTAVTATIDTTGGVTFLATADFGTTAITVVGVENVTTDKVAFQEGADLSVRRLRSNPELFLN